MDVKTLGSKKPTIYFLNKVTIWYYLKIILFIKTNKFWIGVQACNTSYLGAEEGMEHKSEVSLGCILSSRQDIPGKSVTLSKNLICEKRTEDITQ